MTAQADILTVTLNPAVDVATSVEHVVAGPKLRCGPPRFDPGGGGVNVARAVRKLGGTARALIAVGGAMGDRLLDLLATEGVPALPVPVSGETRQSFAATDETTGGQYRFGVPGAALSPQDASKLVKAIVNAAPQDGFLVLSGSVAPGLPDDFQGQIIGAITSKGSKAIVDTSKAALDTLIAPPVTPVYLLRFDDAEAVEAAGHPLPGVRDMVDFGRELIGRHVAEIVVIGLGATGSVLVSASQAFLCHPPMVKEHSKIGAGDAFVGSMTLALAKGESLDIALRWGVAAASATVSTEGTALCDQDTVTARFADCQIEVL